MASAAEAISSSSVEEVVDVERLLAPVSDENPSGENLQYSGLHDEVREARRSEDNLEQGEWRRDTKAAEWHQVVNLTTDALASKTKDLQICAWLCEALVKLYGFAGLRDGLRLMRGLHERFWESLYPEVDDGDLEARINSLTWMERQAGLALKETPITKSVMGASYSFLQWQDAANFDVPEKLDDLDSEELDRINEIKRRAAEEGKITSEQWRVAKSGTRRAYYEQTYALLNECWEEFLALDRVMDEKYGRQTPGLGALKKSLDEIRSVVEKIVKEKRASEPDRTSAGPGVIDEAQTRSPVAAGGHAFVTAG
ncbi:MAG TPA: type VI secretion system protein TssA, partial [Blastocatellia bacterium]|nr:type VI secretion system protein TssA [Blastocatellia bacterium]